MHLLYIFDILINLTFPSLNIGHYIIWHCLFPNKKKNIAESDF